MKPAQLAAEESVGLWVEIQATRPGYEMINALKASHTLMKIFGLSQNKQSLLKIFHQSIEGNAVHITRSGAFGHIALQEMLKTLQQYCGEAGMNEVPGTIREFAESTKFVQKEP